MRLDQMSKEEIIRLVKLKRMEREVESVPQGMDSKDPLISSSEEEEMEECSLCGNPTEEAKGDRAEWHLCRACVGSPAAEAAGFTHRH